MINNFKDKLILLLCLCIFTYLSILNLDTPGIYYDEALFINAALGGNSDLFIHKRLDGIPFMLMPYLGALKSWLYYPIFKYFFINEITIRLPMIIIGASTLFVNYKIIKILFGSSCALIFLALASVEPSTIFHTKIDWGPTALMMLFRSLLILFLIKYIFSKNKAYAYVCGVFAILGAFDKLNFIWIIVAIMLTIIAISKQKNYIKLLIFFLYAIIIYASTFFTNEIAFPDVNKFRSNLITLYHVISGGSVFVTATGKEFYAMDIQYYIVILCITISLIFIIREILINKLDASIFIGILIFSFLIFIQILITRKATGPHHLAMLSPIWLVLIAYGFSIINKTVFDFGYIKIGGIFFSLLLMGLLMVSSVNINRVYQMDISKNENLKINWSGSAQNLASLTINFPKNSVFVFVDWGLATSFQALSQNKFIVFDFWGWFNDGFDADKMIWFKKEFIKSNVYFIVPVNGFENFKNTRSNFVKMNTLNKWNLNKIMDVRDRYGVTTYEIYTIRKE